ncbi:MAG: RluA family pseudouridine synthase [Muribaculaceae bacterium]|nr:RluA family pseudouridine synthase [Muribaculaceae bacterium]
MRQLPCKPGAERAPKRPDIILDLRPRAETRLLDFLYEAMPDRKRTTVKDYLKHRQVMVDGNVTSQWDTPVGPDSEIRVNTTREFQTLANPRLKIVYEDDDILVVNKGYGLLSVSTDNKREGTAYSILRDYVKRVDPRNKLFIVHRLDQHTSGLMLFAKSARAKEILQHNWNNMVLERRYVAVVEGGAPDPAEGYVRTLLAENSEHVVYVTDDASKGQDSLTEYCTLAARGNYALLELQLATGRKNQIRVHMQHIGHPIVGDRKYGASTSPIHRLALHARTLRFVHPITRRDMNFSTPIPSSFRKMI